MGDRRCCCACPYVEDDFRRPNSDVLGPLWYPNTDARIVDYTMEIDTGYVICTQPIWDSEGAFLLKIDVVDPVDADDAFDVVLLKRIGSNFTEKYRVRFSPDAALTWWVIGFKAAMSATWYTDDVELIAGCGTYQEAYMAGRAFNISSDREVIRVGGTTPEFPHYEFWRCHEADWDYMAIGHGGGPRPIRFDTFWMMDHWIHDRTCPFWGCVCGGTPLGGAA